MNDTVVEENLLTRTIHRHGGSVAMAAAAALTAKGEWDLAVLVHYPMGIAWLLPVALDVYLATAAAKRATLDIVIGLLLMMGCQIAVHLVPVFITSGEQVPWGLVVVAVCVPPIIALRATLGMHGGRKIAERERVAEEQVHAARVAAAEADRLRVDAEARLAEERATRAPARRPRARTESDGGVVRPSLPAAASGTGESLVTHDEVTLMRHEVTHAVTHQGDAPSEGDASVTHGVTHGGDASAPRDASGDDAPLTRDERLTLAVMEVLEGTTPSARAAALKHGVDPTTLRRRLAQVRPEVQTPEAQPTTRPAINGVNPRLSSSAQ